jgi:hypothetical protein
MLMGFFDCFLLAAASYEFSFPPSSFGIRTKNEAVKTRITTTKTGLGLVIKHDDSK